jgi:arsenate reductase
MNKKILLLCTGNSCRSQIAEGYLRYFANGKADIFSAGIETHGVNPKAIAIMQEDGINISSQTSNKAEEYQNIDFDFVITVCDNAKEHCPHFTSNAKSYTIIFRTRRKLLGLTKKSWLSSEKSETK